MVKQASSSVGSFLEVSFLGFLEVGRWNNDTSTARDGKALLPPPLLRTKEPIYEFNAQKCRPIGRESPQNLRRKHGGGPGGRQREGRQGEKMDVCTLGPT